MTKSPSWSDSGIWVYALLDFSPKSEQLKDYFVILRQGSATFFRTVDRFQPGMILRPGR